MHRKITLHLLAAGIAVSAYSQTPIPDNDSFAARIQLFGSTVSATGRNTGATLEQGEPDPSFQAEKSVWWTWTAPSNGSVTITTAGSSFDTILTVFTGDALTNLVLVAFNDDSAGTNTSTVDFNVIAGTAYQVAVDGANGDEGNISLQLSMGPTQSPPANDNFANPITLTGAHLSNVAGSNVGATAELGEPFHADEIGQKSVWWTWTAPASGGLTLTTQGSSIDTLLAIYTGDSVSNLTFVAANDEDPLSIYTSRITCNVTTGTVYQIAVDGFDGDEGDIRLRLDLNDPFPVPPNDNFANRITLPSSNFSITATNVGATYEPGEPIHLVTLGGKTVWWQWTAPVSGGVTLTASNNLVDTLVCVYKGTSITNLTFVAGNDEDFLTAIEGDSTAYFNATAGTTYQIVVDGVDGSSGTFQLSLVIGGSDPVPPNDNFANRITLSGSSITTTNQNLGATLEPGEPLHHGYYGGKSVWWKWTSPGSGFVTIDTIGSLFDTILAVYTGSALTNLVEVASDDESGGNYTSLVTFPTKNNITYQIAVDGFDGDSYDLTLHVHFVAASYSLNVTTNPVGKGSVLIDPLPDQSGKYAPGSVVTLTATPISGVIFSNWSGSVASTNNPLVLTINSNKTLVAGFYVIPTTNIWTGANATNGNWTTGDNWTGGTPNPGDALIFPAGASRLAANTNDFPSHTTFKSIGFGGSDYMLSGNPIALNGGIGSTNSMGTNTLNLNVQLNANQTFRCGNSGAQLVLSGNVDLANRTLTTETVGNVTISGIISGSGSIVKTNSGTLSLAGNITNTFAGSTFVNQGTLELGQAGLAIAGLLTIGDAAGGANADVVRFIGNSQLAASTAVTINSSGKLDLNGFSGSVGPLTMTGSTIATGPGALALNSDVTVNAASTQAIISGNLSLQGAIRTFNVAEGSAPTDLLISAVVGDGSGPGGIQKTGPGSLKLTASNTYSGATTINGGTLNISNNSALGSTSQGTTVNSNASLSVSGLSIAGETLSLAGGTFDSNTSSNFWSGNISLSGTSIITVATNAPLNLAGGISGPGGLTKSAGGTLIFSGNKGNAYSGSTTVEQGTLLLSKTQSNAVAGPLVIGDGIGGANADVVRFAGNSQLGNAPAVTINSSGLLDLNGFSGVVGSLAMTGGNVTTGSGSLGLHGDLIVNAASIQSSISGRLGLEGGVRTFSIDDSGASIDLVISAVIEDGNGTGGIIKTGIGTMELTTANTYSGSTVLSQGKLIILNGSALGTATPGTVVTSNAVLSVLGGLISAEQLSLTGGTLSADSGSNFWFGDITLTNICIITGATNSFLSLSNRISGPGSLIKEGTGTLAFTGPLDNSYSGATTINAGTLMLSKTTSNAVPGSLTIGDGAGGLDSDLVRVQTAQQISSASQVTIASSGLLTLSNVSNFIGSISGNGHLELAGAAAALSTGDDGSTVFDGLILGAGQFTKTGTGTLSLNGNNLYSGPTWIDGGKLIINGSQLGSSITINPAGTLGGTGHVSNVSCFGVVSPGAGPGILWTSNLSFFSNATYRVELNGSSPGTGYDQIRASGNISLAGTLDVTLGFTPLPNASFVLITNEGIQPNIGNFAGLAEGSTLTIGGLQFQISYSAGLDSNDVILTISSPPPSLALSLLADGTAQLQGSGQSGQTYIIEAADALNPPIAWVQLVTNTIDPTGIYQFIDTNAPFAPARYYRTRFP